MTRKKKLPAQSAATVPAPRRIRPQRAKSGTAYVTAREYAAITGVNERTVWRYVAAGVIYSEKIGYRRLIPRPAASLMSA